MIVEEFVAWIGKAADEERADGASALVALWLTGSLGAEEQEAAEAAMTALLDDPSDDVRAALAFDLASEPAAPKHVVLALAVDKPSIALPVLARSPVFLDAELAELVASGAREHQIAIACRAEVPGVVAIAIGESGCRDAAMALLMNEGANTPPAALHAIGLRYGAEVEIRRLLMKRHDLPAATRIMLIDKLADTLREEAGAQDIPAARIEALVCANRDRAIVAWASRAGERELEEIVMALVQSGRLTTAFLLRAVCMGNVALFSAALAHLSGLSARRMETVLADNRASAFRAIYVKAGLPDQAFDVFALAVGLWRKGMAVSEPGPDLVYRVTRDLLAAFGARGGETFDPLLVLLRRLAAEAAREHARCKVNRIAIEAQERERLLLEASHAEEEDEDAAAPEELFPVIEVPAQVLADFAVHFAEEIVQMEQANDDRSLADALELAHAVATLEPANDDDEPAPHAPIVIDMGDARRFGRAA